MLVTIEELNQSENGKIDFEFEENFEEINLHSPAKVKLTVSKTGGGFINVRGKVLAELNAVCDNCLKEFIYKLIATLMKILPKILCMTNIRRKPK